jgi:hypothetical protein
VVDIIIAAVPVNTGINTAVKPAVSVELTKYKIAVTMILTILNTYTSIPEMNLWRRIEVHTISNINVPITVQDQIMYKTFDHIGNARFMVNKIVIAAIIIAIPNNV